MAVKQRPPQPVLDHIEVDLNWNGVFFTRFIYPAENVPVQQVLAAAKADEDFLNPMVDSGTLEAVRGKRTIVLGRFDGNDLDDFLVADVEEARAHYEDDTFKPLSID